MLNGVLLVLASAAIASAGGELLCSEQSFSRLGGAFPSPKSPHEYTTCADGVVQTVPCPAGQRFDAHTQSCTDRPVLAESRTEITFQFEELCNDPDVVQIFPNPTNCSQYVICFGLVPIEQSCTGGLLFNPELQTCDIPTNVVCGYSCPAVDDPYNPVWLPDARLEDCARHYLCFQGEPIQFFCYSNLYFDTVSRTCTYPQYADCRVPGVYCNTTSTVNIENPRSCTSYYTCVNGFPQFRQCLDDQYFSVEQSMCVPGACSPSTTTLEPTSTSTVELTSTTASNGTTPTFTEPPTTTLDPNPGTTAFTTTTEGGSISTDVTSTSIGSTMPVEPTTAETTFFPSSTDFTPTVTESSTISTSTEGTTPTDSTPEPGTTTTIEPQTTTETTSSTVTDSSTVEMSTEESTSTATQEVSTTTIDFTTTPEPLTTTTDESPSTTTEPTTTLEPTEVTTTPEPLTTTTTEIPLTTTTDESPSTTTESTTTTESATPTLEPTTTTETPTTTESTTTELPSTTTTEMVTVDPNLLCAGLGIAILPYPGNCYMYILCIEGIGAVASCPANEIFNPITRTCAPGNQETCTLT